jgi:hypothetical protein
VTPAEILALAETLLERADPKTAGLWPRAAALLTRQALEQALDECWRAKSLPLDTTPTRIQLICLREYLDDQAQASDVSHAWSALSGACHHHPYEIAPTAGELRGWLETVTAFVARTS